MNYLEAVMRVVLFLLELIFCGIFIGAAENAIQFEDPIPLPFHIHELEVGWDGSLLGLSKAGQSLVFYRSTDQGDTWSTGMDLADGVGMSIDLEEDNAGRIYVVYSRYGRIYLRRSDDRGSSWSEEIGVGFSQTGGIGVTLQLSIDEADNLYLASGCFYNFFNLIPVCVRWSFNLGKSWNGPMRFSTGRYGGFQPSIAAGSAGHVCLTWCEGDAGMDWIEWDLYSVSSKDFGSSWSPTRKISRIELPKYVNGRAAIHMDHDDHTYMVWYFENVYKFDRITCFQHSADGGITWGTRSDINEAYLSDVPVSNPTILVTPSNQIYTLFSIVEGYTIPYQKIKLSSSSDMGNTWSEPQEVYKMSGSRSSLLKSSLTGDLYIGLIATVDDENKSLLIRSLSPSVQVSGAVRSPEGEPIADALITFSNEGGTCVSNGNGIYTKVLDKGWSGTVTPYKEYFDFSPEEIPLEELKRNESDQDFNGTTYFNLKLKGKVTELKSWLIRKTVAALTLEVDPRLNEDIDLYQLQRTEVSSSAQTRYQIKATKVKNGTYTYADTTIEPKKTYTYKLIALDDQGNILLSSNSVTLN